MRPVRLPAALLTVLLLAACTGAPPRALSRVEPAPRVPLAEVLAAVRRAAEIRALPTDLMPALAAAARDVGFDNEKCEAGPAADRIEPCVFGDRAGGVRVVLYGDSHAGMWLPAMIPIAERRHWRLQFLGKPGCPAPAVRVWDERAARPFTVCDRFRDHVADRIRAERPALVVVTSGSFARKRDRAAVLTAAEWEAGLRTTLAALRSAAGRVVVLGDIPVLDESPPECLAVYSTDIRACATGWTAATARVWNAADQAAAKGTGSGYVPVLPWLCTAVCTPVIGNVAVYRNRFQLTATYARMLNGVLEDALVADAAL